MTDMQENPETCGKCNGTFKVLAKDGTMHTCFDCLVAGRMDVLSPYFSGCNDMTDLVLSFLEPTASVRLGRNVIRQRFFPVAIPVSDTQKTEQDAAVACGSRSSI